MWLIEDSDRLHPQRRRSLSDRAAVALLARIDGDLEPARMLQPIERSRLDDRATRLAHDEDAADLFAAWLRPALRRPAVDLFVQPADLPDLREDDRVVAGGVSDPRAEISAPDFFEAHIATSDLPDLRRDFLLRSSDAPNVKLHVAPRRPPRPLPLSTLLVDLAADGGPRERGRLIELLRGLSA